MALIRAESRLIESGIEEIAERSTVTMSVTELVPQRMTLSGIPMSHPTVRVHPW